MSDWGDRRRPKGNALKALKSSVTTIREAASGTVPPARALGLLFPSDPELDKRRPACHALLQNQDLTSRPGSASAVRPLRLPPEAASGRTSGWPESDSRLIPESCRTQRPLRESASGADARPQGRN